MKLFAKRPFCSECGVVFEPRRDEYNDLCLPHAKPKMEIDYRRRAVADWAASNWERLEPQMKEEQEKTRAAFNEVMNASLRAQQEAMRPMPMNQMQMAGYGGNPLSVLLGGAKRL